MTSRADAKRALEEAVEETRRRLLSGDISRLLLTVLRTHLPCATDNLYLVGHLIEQGEAIYDVLVDGRTIITIELARIDVSRPPSVQEISVERFRQGMSKLPRRKLDTAMRL